MIFYAYAKHTANPAGIPLTHGHLYGMLQLTSSV